MSTLDLTALRSKFDASKRGQPRGAPYLPELRDDVRWMLANLRDIEAGILKSIDWELSSSNPNPHRAVKPLIGKLDPEQLKAEVREGTELLRSKLNELLREKQGISYPGLLAIRRFYPALQRFEDNSRYLIVDRGSGGEWNQWMRKLKSVDVKDIHSSWSWEKHAQSYEDWIPIPTARGGLEIPAMNEWMSEGYSPIWLVEKHTAYDGLDAMTETRPGRAAADMPDHDERHVLAYGSRGACKPLACRDYFKAYRSKLAEEIHDEKLRKTLEAKWFFVYHELSGYGGYGPSTLIQALGNPSNFELFKGKLQPHDLGDFFPEGVPDDAMLRRADDWLVDFAQKVKNGQVPAPS